jgi:hypothetical protein
MYEGTKYLDGGVRDADRGEDELEVVGHEPVSGPLREEGDRDDDPDPLAVTCAAEEGLPADIGGD